MAAWQRVLFGDVPLGLGVLLAMAGLATNWIIVALPAMTLAMVKLHDVIAGQLVAGQLVHHQPPENAKDLEGSHQQADGILQDH